MRPIAISTDNTRLFAVNTPDNRLEVFNISSTGTLTKSYSIPVGLEPVAVAVRNSNEVWVVNHLSDSVSIVDVSGTQPRVKQTLLVGDEPRDIVFAGTGNSKAFITTAHRGQHRTNSTISGVTGAGDPQLTTAGVNRADVWVFDPANLGTAFGGTPSKIMTFFADTPRALATSPDKQTVYVAAFKSGNRTTEVGREVICDGFGTTPCTILGTTYPGGNIGPSKNTNLIAGSNYNVQAPETTMIVRWNTSTSKWEDQNGRDWTTAIKFTLPDKDVFAVSVSTLAETANYSGVGTTLFNMVTNPVSGKIYVSNVEANNFARFEGPGDFTASAGGGGVRQTLQGNIAKTRITVIDPSAGTVNARHLNKHIDYSYANLKNTSQRAPSLSTPLEMAVSSNGATLYVAAFGTGFSTGKVGVFSTSTLENNTFNPSSEYTGYISVTGGGAAGLVLDEERSRLYVYTRFDNGISVVNTGTKAEAQHVTMFNPEPTAVTAGRQFMYDAVTSSSNGESSCASCHIFGDNDDIAWNLGNPDDAFKTTPVNVKASAGVTSTTTPPVNGTNTANGIHPMKGPMTTQTFRGMQNHGHLHWRGDRVSGAVGSDTASLPPYDEVLSFKNFIVAFDGLLGLPSNTITTTQMQTFADFAMQLIPPPNPVRNIDNSLTAAQDAGKKFFKGCDGKDMTTLVGAVCNGSPSWDLSWGSGHGSDGTLIFPSTGFGSTCNGCHQLNPANGFFGTDGENSFEILPQTMKIPHLRNMYTKIGMFGEPAFPSIPNVDTSFKGDQVRGFGFMHDGAMDTIFRFISANNFVAGGSAGELGFSSDSATATTQKQNVEQFMLAFDSDLAPVVGQMITINSSNSGNTDLNNRITLLRQRAGTSFTSLNFGTSIKECDLVAYGWQGGTFKSWLYRPAANNYEPDDGSAAISETTLKGYASTAGQEITFLCVPPGSGPRIGLDRDNDDAANRVDSNPARAAGTGAACAAGTGNCSGTDTTCETNTTTDINNCGGCGVVCPVPPNTTAASCSSSACGYSACSTGYLDCDGIAYNGCEYQGSSCPGIAQVAAGDDQACALPTAVTWATNYNGTPSGAAGGYCWGQNGSGRLGDNSTTTHTSAWPVSTTTDFVQMSAGLDFTCGVRSGGTVQCWGANANGQLGDGTTVGKQVPTTVGGSITTAKFVSASNADVGSFACALLSDKSIKCWGQGLDGQLGNGASASSSTPVAVSGISSAVSVAVGRNHACAVLNTGTVKCWGKNDVGQLGNNSTTASNSPVDVLDVGDAIQVEAGRDATCVTRASGRVKCWGLNSNGQLGNGNTTNSGVAVSVSGITNAKRVSFGDEHACALLSDNTVKCWGLGTSGQLGNNTTSSSSTPVSVSGLSGTLKDISVGDDFSCVMDSNQKVICWGANWGYQLGEGTTTNRLTAKYIGFPKLAPEDNCAFNNSTAGRSYWNCSTGYTAANATTKCTAKSYALVKVDDATESSFIAGWIGGDRWTGFTDAAAEGTWKWADGTTGGYPNWAPGEPNGSTTENCGRLSSSAQMVDVACGNSQGYICEYATP